MSVRVTTNKDDNSKLSIEMDNGHVQALRKIVKDYNLKGENEAIIFMLGLISQANGTAIEINGNKYVPPDAFRKTT